MTKEEIKDGINSFILNKVFDIIDHKIYLEKENFNYLERRDIYVKGELIKIGSDFEIVIGGYVEIDDFDNNHDNETEYYVQFLRGGKNE